MNDFGNWSPVDGAGMSHAKAQSRKGEDGQDGQAEDGLEKKLGAATCRAYEIMREVCADRMDAYEWFVQSNDASAVWDHVVDGDPIDKTQVDMLFEAMLLRWPQNMFWREYGTVLGPVIACCISAWRWSDREPGGRVKAWDAVTEVACAVTFILRGMDGVKRWMPEFRDCVWQVGKEDDVKDNQPEVIL